MNTNEEIFRQGFLNPNPIAKPWVPKGDVVKWQVEVLPISTASRINLLKNHCRIYTQSGRFAHLGMGIDFANCLSSINTVLVMGSKEVYISKDHINPVNYGKAIMGIYDNHELKSRIMLEPLPELRVIGPYKDGKEKRRERRKDKTNKGR